jgi:hypothetical protein
VFQGFLPFPHYLQLAVMIHLYHQGRTGSNTELATDMVCFLSDLRDLMEFGCQITEYDLVNDDGKKSPTEVK